MGIAHLKILHDAVAVAALFPMQCSADAVQELRYTMQLQCRCSSQKWHAAQKQSPFRRLLQISGAEWDLAMKQSKIRGSTAAGDNGSSSQNDTPIPREKWFDWFLPQ